PDLTIAPDMLTLAEHILDSKASEFDPATFRDRYEEALLAHLKAKQAGAVPERRKTFAPPHRVVNLMEALRRSVAEEPHTVRHGMSVARPDPTERSRAVPSIRSNRPSTISSLPSTRSTPNARPARHI